MIQGINGRGKSTGWILNRLNRPSHLEAEDERETVLSIINGVLKEGDAALLRYTKKYDKADLADPQDMRVTEEEIQEAYDSTSPELVKILERAAERIRRFHARQKTETWLCFDEKDIILGQKVIPMERVGVYVPGGKAAYPSSVLMNVIPPG